MGSEKTLPFKSHPIEEDGDFPLGMRPPLRTTGGGKGGARERGGTEQFGTNEGGKRKKGEARCIVPLQGKTWMRRSLLALGDWPGGSRGVADSVAVDDELDAAVALTAFGGVVGGDRLRFAEAVGGDG